MTARHWLLIIGIIVGIMITSTILSTCNDGLETAQKEFKPSALLKKYEYFKDLSSAIDKKRADIEMYQSEIKDLPNIEKDDKEYLRQRKSELLGIISMHNQLVSEYNSAMVKFNYKLCNKGDMPYTNLEPLPREYKSYLNNLK